MRGFGVRRRLGALRPRDPDGTPVAPGRSHPEHDAIARWEAGERPPPPTRPRPTGDAPLRVAFVIPPFRAASGGHGTILHLARALEARGHDVSLHVHDPGGAHASLSEAHLGRLVRTLFGPLQGSVSQGLEGFPGADVAVATGWQTAHATMLLPEVHGRAYLVQDHEPDFHGASAERLWAGATYRLGMHHVCAGEWLAELVAERYGARAAAFALAVDREVFRPREAERAPGTVLACVRPHTPRRALPLLELALARLHAQRPDVDLRLFGDGEPPVTSFPYRHLGLLEPAELAEAFATATVGVSLSLTNHSLVALEMAACGLPVVELDMPSTRRELGREGPIELALPSASAIARAITRLLDDPDLRARRGREGAEWAARPTWAAAAERVEHALRETLR